MTSCDSISQKYKSVESMRDVETLSSVCELYSSNQRVILLTPHR